jgi:hypothetical protein
VIFERQRRNRATATVRKRFIAPQILHWPLAADPMVAHGSASFACWEALRVQKTAYLINTSGDLDRARALLMSHIAIGIYRHVRI